MGSSISKSKIFDMPKGEHRCSTTSSQRTMVADEPPKTNNKKPFIKPKFFRNKQSLAKRKHYKRKSVVTKSIIGRPTNFKVCFRYLCIFFYLSFWLALLWQHLNSSTHMDNEDEVIILLAYILIQIGLTFIKKSLLKLLHKCWFFPL